MGWVCGLSGSGIVGSVMVKSLLFPLEDARNACGRGIREDNAIAAAVSLSCQSDRHCCPKFDGRLELLVIMGRE